MRRPASALVLLLLLGPAGRPAAQGPVVEDRFDVTTCDVLEANGESCGQVRFGWADCPGQRGVPCDVCYSPSGTPFAYVKRTNKTYRLTSGCEHLEQMPAEDVYLIASEPEDAERWESAGVDCAERGGEFICQKPPGAKKPPEPSKPPDLTPAQIAAGEIRRQWQEGKGGPSFSYAAVPFGPKGKVKVKDKTGKEKIQETPPGTLHAVEVRGSFEVAYDAKGKTVAGHVAAQGAAGGVTGTFFNRNTLEPGGPVLSGEGEERQVLPRRTLKGVTDPKTKKPTQVPVPRTFLGSGQDRLFVRDLPTDLAAFQQKIKVLEEDTKLQGLGGMGRLLRGGEGAVQEARQVQGLGGQAGDSADARTVAGIDAAGSRLILLVQEEDEGAKTGAGITQLGEVLKQLGATEAVILDGGGSAQISIPSLGVRYNGDGRRQPTAILFR